MALTKEDLQAIQQLLQPMQDDIAGLKQGQTAMRAEMDKRFNAVDEKLEHLESSINYAATDAQTAIKRHEKEFHMV